MAVSYKKTVDQILIYCFFAILHYSTLPSFGSGGSGGEEGLSSLLEGVVEPGSWLEAGGVTTDDESSSSGVVTGGVTSLDDSVVLDGVDSLLSVEGVVGST